MTLEEGFEAWWQDRSNATWASPDLFTAVKMSWLAAWQACRQDCLEDVRAEAQVCGCSQRIEARIMKDST